jgi:hypothetical protein
MAKMRSSSDLRSFLVRQMEGVADGKVEVVQAKSVGYLAQQIYNTINLEIRIATAKAKYGDSFEIKSVDFDG